MDHPRNRFIPSTHFSTTRKNSTHGTLWRLYARRVESCSKNNSLTYDIRAGRLVSSSRVASQLDHLLARWQGLMCFLTDAWPLFLCACSLLILVRGKMRERERKEKEGRDRRGGRATWHVLLFRGPRSVFPFRRIPALSDVFLLPLCFFSFRPTLRSFFPLPWWADDENYVHRRYVVHTA